jgi:hypothetical protein
MMNLASAPISASKVRETPRRLTLAALETDLPAALAHALSNDAEPTGASSASDKAVLASLGATSKDLPEKSDASAARGVFAEQSDSIPANGASLFMANPLRADIGAPLDDATSIAPSATSLVVDDRMKNAPSKVLTFQMEPEDLGVVTVRMQITKTRVSLKIDVESPAVQTILSRSSDELAQALGASGHRVEDIAIRVSPAPVPSANPSDAGANENSFSYGQGGDGGGFDGNGGMGKGQGESLSRSPKGAARQTDEGASRSGGSSGAHGVYV